MYTNYKKTMFYNCITAYLLIAALYFFAPGNVSAEEKFFDRDPQPSSYSALCQYYKQEDLPPLEDLQNKKPLDLRACDLSGFDLTQYGKNAKDLFSFDTDTVWPDKEKMPKGFSPEKIMNENNKTSRQTQAIGKIANYGKGYAIGVIGKPPLLTHNEYADNLSIYKQHTLSPLASRDSTAALSVLAGSETGILPKALFYYDAPLSYGKIYGARDMYPEAKSLRDMLIFNREQLPENKRIKAVVMFYRDYPLATDGMVTMGKAQKDAMEQGVPIFSGDDIEEFKDYNIFPEKQIRIASPADDEAYAIIPPAPEIQAAWLAGIYIAALNIQPDLTKSEFFWLLKRTAAFENDGSKKQEVSESGQKKTLRPVKLLETLKFMSK